jgi:hypothetical protein
MVDKDRNLNQTKYLADKDKFKLTKIFGALKSEILISQDIDIDGQRPNFKSIDIFGRLRQKFKNIQDIWWIDRKLNQPDLLQTKRNLNQPRYLVHLRHRFK